MTGPQDQDIAQPDYEMADEMSEYAVTHAAELAALDRAAVKEKQ